jgi:hypothetical protein
VSGWILVSFVVLACSGSGSGSVDGRRKPSLKRENREGKKEVVGGLSGGLDNTESVGDLLSDGISLWTGIALLLLDNVLWWRCRKGREKPGSRYIGNLGAVAALAKADDVAWPDGGGGGGGRATSFSTMDNMVDIFSRLSPIKVRVI